MWAIDPMVDQDLAYVSTITTKRKKETTKESADLLDSFHKKTWPTSASTLLRVCFFSIKKKVVQKKTQKKSHAIYSSFAGPTLVVVREYNFSSVSGSAKKSRCSM